jgi:hypothetical protein
MTSGALAFSATSRRAVLARKKELCGQPADARCPRYDSQCMQDVGLGIIDRGEPADAPPYQEIIGIRRLWARLCQTVIVRLRSKFLELEIAQLGDASEGIGSIAKIRLNLRGSCMQPHGSVIR